LSDFGPAGQRLWDDLARDDDTYSIGVMVVEACRITDRLERLNDLLGGEESLWMRLVAEREDGTTFLVRVNSPMQEARQQASVLRQLLSEIRRQRGPTVRSGDDDDDLAGL